MGVEVPILKRLTGRTMGDLAIEVVLIVLGITCALWFDARKDAWQERKLEEAILHELAATLVSDTSDFRSTLAGLDSVEAAVDTVVLFISEKRGYEPELDQYLLRSSGGYGIFHNRAAYESLHSAGLPLIRSDALRQHIVRYYDFLVPGLQDIEAIYAFPYRREMVLPQVVQKLAVSESGFTPRDYRSLQEDIEYLNVLRLWRITIDQQSAFTLDVYRAATSLLGEVEAELASRGR